MQEINIGDKVKIIDGKHASSVGIVRSKKTKIIEFVTIDFIGRKKTFSSEILAETDEETTKLKS